MASLANTNSSLYLAQIYRNSLDTSSVYFYVAKSFDWNSEKYLGTTSDVNPPSPNNSYLERREIAETIIAAKRVLTGDSVFACKKNIWTSGTIYDYYRDDYSPTNLSITGANDLDNALYFVVTDDYKVYICLYSPGTPSFITPSSTTTSVIKNADGYWWKYLYSISNDNYNLYSTSQFIPCFVDATVSNYALANSGAVYVSVVSNPNTTNVPGTFFTKILGDGTGGVCRITVTATSLTTGIISEAIIVSNGRNYNTAFVDLTNCKSTLNNLNNNTGTTFSIPNASIKIIIPPYIGHGYDPTYDVKASNLIIIKQFVPADNYIIPSNCEYRITGILENPLNINDEILTQSLISGCDRVIFPSDSTTDYNVGEIVRQGNSSARVISWDSTNKILYYYQNSYIDNLNYAKFSGNTAIIGETSATTLVPDISISTNVNSLKFINGYSYSDIKKYSGKIDYITFSTPTIRNSYQLETLSLLVQF